MRLLWIALAAATAITIAAVGGLVIGPRLVRHHRHAIAAHHHHIHVWPTHVIDPWGTPYRLTPSGHGYAISSAGPDRVFGTADDVR